MLTKEDFPEEAEVFFKDIVDETAKKLGPTFYTKEADKLSFMNQAVSLQSKQIYIKIDECDDKDLSEEQGECADDTELSEYYGNLNFELNELKNFIDY